MDIYSPKVLSDRTIKNFLPTRLAIKELAGQLYFCKSKMKDIEKYTGSGVRWLNIVKKYGKDNIKTLWVSDWYYCPHEIQEVALHFSRENQIVENDKWANLNPENGLDGGRRENNHLKIYNQLPRSEEHLALQSAGRKKYYDSRTEPGSRAKKVMVDTIVYGSITEACTKIGTSWYLLLKSGRATIV
jgi:hypothetical protein